MNRLLKIINQKNKEKCMVLLEEFPTITVDVIPTIATGRSNKIAVCLCIQDATQLRKEYGREQADVILNTVGNIISGQVTGDSAKQISEQIGKIMQDRESLSINRTDTSISKSLQLEYAVPPSKISGLSSGEFVGRVADTPDQKIPQKAFHCEIEINFEAIKKEEESYKPIPVIRQVDHGMVQRNFQQIKQDIRDIIDAEIDRMNSDPALSKLIIKKQ
jgi:hypothetical protein